MDTLFSRHRNAMVLVAVLFLQLVMLAFQVKRDKDVPLIRIWAVSMITPVEKLSSSAIRSVVEVWRNYLDLRGARDESRRLGEAVAGLKLSHSRLREEALEARRLKALLAFREQTPSTTLAVRVIGSSASETSRVLFIDRGSESGIRPNMAVITPDGIVGKVHRVFRGAAQVLVITDPDSGVGAMIENSRMHGALRGHGGFFCQLRYIVNEEQVEVGERIFTSGEDMIYPKGLPIGTVTGVKPGNVFKEIAVQPSARLNRLEEVLVVLTNVDQELPLKPEPAPVVAGALPGPSGAQPATAGAQAAPAVGAAPPKPPARPPLVADSARAKPETDADKLLEAYRAAQAKKPGSAAAPGGSAARPPATTPGTSGGAASAQQAGVRRVPAAPPPAGGTPAAKPAAKPPAEPSPSPEASAEKPPEDRPKPATPPAPRPDPEPFP